MPLAGASELDYVEDMPTFSPDGKWVLFVRYQFENNGIPSMDLYRVPFNGGRGGIAEPVKGASLNGQYNYFPRYSPNGKWISFCRGTGKNGVFARKTSDLYLLAPDRSEAVPLNFNKAACMDSWHYWSSDSHWLVISSNREPNQLTALYLIYLDQYGKDYPPVKLIDYDNLKVNTPQFIPNYLDINGMKNLKVYLEKIYQGGAHE